MSIEINKQRNKRQSQYKWLTLNSPLFEHLQPADYNLYDKDTGIIHIRKMGYPQSLLFQDICNHTHNNGKIVTYNIEQCGTTCFNIRNTVTSKSLSILLHESEHRETVEFIFQIKLKSDEAILPSVDKEGFLSRMRIIRLNTDVFNHLHTDIHLDSKAETYCKVYARTVEAYRAGIVHIKYLIDSLPEYSWYERRDEDTVHHKFLAYGGNDYKLYLSFSRLCKKSTSKNYRFYLDFSEVTEEVDMYRAYVHGDLLQKLKPIYRKYSLGNILMEL